MKKLVLCLVVLTAVNVTFGQRAKKVLFVIVDGISADVIEKLNTPGLDSISAVGGYTRAHVGGEKAGYSETPTISAVGYNSLLTGTWVNKHNVWDNDIAAPNYAYPTIFRLFREQYPEKKIAVFSSWLDNRTKLVGDGLASTGNLHVDYHYDGLELDSVRFPQDEAREFMHKIDESVVDTAAAYIRKYSPDLSWVYLEYTDDMGHGFGDSEQFYRSIGYMDKQMARLWSAIKFREQQFGEDWQIYITTDHGRHAKDGKEHGGQTDRERLTWIVTNAGSLNSYFKSGNAGIVDIMPSIASHLGVKMSPEIAREVDGVSLTGKISAVSATATLNGKVLKLGWTPVNSVGKVKIWVSETNNFKTGGHDEYKLLGEASVKSAGTEITITGAPSKFYKIALEFPMNTLNRWVIVK
ncbi:MAG: alkaline phosphatase family protein [Chitinophagaceae bacterium]